MGSIFTSLSQCTWTNLWRYSSDDDYDYDQIMVIKVLMMMNLSKVMITLMIMNTVKSFKVENGGM